MGSAEVPGPDHDGVCGSLAALAAAEVSVQHAQAALATAGERLRRAQEVQMRFREMQTSGTRAA